MKDQSAAQTRYFVIENEWGLQIVRTNKTQLTPAIVESAIGPCDYYTQIFTTTRQSDAIEYVRQNKAKAS